MIKLHRYQIHTPVTLIAAALCLTLGMFGSPDEAAAQDGSEVESFITVVMADGDDTFSWSDRDQCASSYNLILMVTPVDSSEDTVYELIASPASGSTEVTQAITYSVEDWFTVSRVYVLLYCGTFDADSTSNTLVSSTPISKSWDGLRNGTYSSAPLTGLTINPGALSPDFDQGKTSYSAEVPSNTESITLVDTVLDGYETTFLKNPNGLAMALCSTRRCSYGYGVEESGSELSDADSNLEGFQVDLDRGANRLGLGVDKGTRPGGFQQYSLTITVLNAPATGQPSISGTARASETLTADTSEIADTDGLENATFTYQWVRVNSDSTESDISNATGATYVLTSDDVGKTVKVRVDFTDDAGYEETLTSEATAEIVAGGL